MTIQLAYQKTLVQLYDIYEHKEAANIADWTIEHVTGQRKIDRILYKDLPLTIQQGQTLQTFTEQLLNHKPIQYVLGEAWFCNMKLYVDENVLIPRPETEELVGWIVQEIQNSKFKIQKKILDVGTGSGCIAIALKKEVNDFEVHAIDISSGALEVAKRNATQQNVEIIFKQLDFLNINYREQLGIFDLIISNPPYVKKSEESTMQKNVSQYEPYVALFVPDDDALKFYVAITEFAKTNLVVNGSIYVEINESLGEEVTALFKHNGFENIALKKDLQGKDRMIKASAY